MKALVVRVETPKIACKMGVFEATVVYAQKVKYSEVDKRTGEVLENEFTKKKKRNVFVPFRPSIGEWIEVRFV